MRAAEGADLRPVPVAGVARARLRAMVALSLGLVIGWIAVLPLSYFRTYLASPPDEPRLVDVPRNDGVSARPPASPEPRRDTTNATNPANGTNKGPSHARRLAHNAPSPKPIKTSLIAPPSVPPGVAPNVAPGVSPRGVDVAASDPARRGDPAARPLPFPESKPETLPGWTVREVYGSTAILDGPERSFKAARGDIVPGVGRLESIVRWGDRWIVATESGLISTP